MLKQEAWEFVLLNEHHLDCLLVIDSQNFYTSRCFVPAEYQNFSIYPSPENIVIYLPFHSPEEASEIFGGYIFQETKKLGHVSEELVNVDKDIENEERTLSKDDQGTESQSKIIFSDILRESDEKVYKTNQEQFQCYYCGKTFERSKALRQHKYQVHREDAEYKCSQCPSVFRTPSILQNHIKTHMEPMYQCPVCPRKFKLKHHLVRHGRKCKINS